MIQVSCLYLNAVKKKSYLVESLDDLKREAYLGKFKKTCKRDLSSWEYLIATE